MFVPTRLANSEIYPPSLHDALPISLPDGAEVEGQDRHAGGGALVEHQAVGFGPDREDQRQVDAVAAEEAGQGAAPDRKSTRLNSSHLVISYAVFCLKKKREINSRIT